MQKYIPNTGDVIWINLILMTCGLPLTKDNPLRLQ